MKPFQSCAIGITLVWAMMGSIAAQPPGGRVHRVIEKGPLRLIPSNTTLPVPSQVSIEVIGDTRIIRSNGIPNHATGRFPNRGNPNPITTQSHVFRVPAEPRRADRITPLQGMFGVAINGVPFEPGAAEFFDGQPGWQYEPLSGAIGLGIDASHAHVQPNGKYHYHGLPTGLLDSVRLDPTQHSPLVGWSADGFPVYAINGFEDPADSTSKARSLVSSYRLKSGRRPGGAAPGGTYDGTFVADYQYVAGSGDLDECNGRFTVTPEFPDGTYAYYLTEQWPVVPRQFRGTPSADFQHGPRGGRGPRRGPPGGFGGRGPSRPPPGRFPR
ncbi:MAG: YHYH protein [Planctomycetota bacterium]